MAARYRWLYPRAIAAAGRQRKGEGIWLVINNFSTGGAQSSARRLLVGLAAQGVPVRAAVIEEQYSHPTPGRRALVEAGIRILALPPTGSRVITPEVEILLAAIDYDRPQAVLFWNLRPAFKVLLADALLDVPVFDVSPGEMFFESLDSYFAISHAGLPYRTARDYGARLAGVIVKYQAEAQRAAEVLGAPVHVVPNGVPLPEALPIDPARRNGMVFGTAARINPRKRLEDLLEALRLANGRMPAYTLKIAGGVEVGCEEYAARLRALSEGLPVEWIGEVSDLPAFHRQLDAFVMVSEPAGCPNASLEAMAAGLAVVATDAGGASEQVIDGRTGRLVPGRDPQALAAALVEMAAQSGLRQQMGRAGRDLIRDRFSLERMIADYRRICLEDGL
jgi:glycosyltransferase involved in cell wall biosynthesis